MSDLSKQQLILLALLVSFVTSLSTGIVTVSLMQQAPANVTRTVSQVIEKTIQQVVPQSASVSDATGSSSAETVSSAVKTVSQSLVRIEDGSSGAAIGDGLIVTANGAIVTDKSVIAQATSYAAILSDGTKIPVIVTLTQNDGQIVFLQPAVATTPKIDFTPAAFAGSVSLGQEVLSLYATSSEILGEGMIDFAPGTTTDIVLDQDAGTISASIDRRRTPVSSVLFDLNGSAIGMKTSSSADGFYPLSRIKDAIPQ
ncbi:MAG: hypothetical protein KGI49_02850 [Patescibacteria group bacterium]|nr:hypothetical protein [Patescibacteria group bacterium]